MFIELDASIASATLNPGAIASLENLAIAFVEGKHLIFGPSAALEFLSKQSVFGARAKGGFAAAMSRRAEIGAIKSKLVKRLLVVAGTPSRATTPAEIVVQADWFGDSSNSQASVLLVEDQNDATVLGQLWSELSGLASVPGLRIAWNVVSGGGSNTWKEYKTLQSQKRPGLCIVDSDKWSECSPLGATARAVQAEDDASRPHVQLAVLKVREIENLMPLAVVGFSTSLPTPSHFQFIDLKGGLRGYDLDNTLSASARSQWVGLGASRKPACAACCVAPRRKQCCCQLIPGCGRKVLLTTCQSIRGTTWMSQLRQWQQEEWRRIGRLVAAWFAAPTPVMT